MISLKNLGYTAVTLFMVLSFRLTAEIERVLTLDDGKAHYVIEVMKHITWPNEDQISHFNIVILCNNTDLLDAFNRKIKPIIRGKNISIEQLKDSNNIKTNVNLVVVCRNKSSLIPKIVKNHGNVLIINDGTTGKQHLMVGLLVVRQNIKLTVNRENLIKHGFVISNSLLDFAGTKADLVDQLKDKEDKLNDVLKAVKTQEEQLKKLNDSLIKSKVELQITQTNLIKQNQLLVDNQTQLASLTKSKKSIISELASKQNYLIDQQKLLTEKETENIQQLQKLDRLHLSINEVEKKLQQQLTKLKQQNNIIEGKEQKITGQRKLLYITVAIAIVILLLTLSILRISRLRKKANKELARLNEQLYEFATTDDMTTLFNRRHFLETAQRELNQLQRTKKMGAVLMIDIDHFKNINDSHGHAAGDQILIEVAKALKDNLRDYDIVGRIGGEEFAMFLPNSPIETAIQIAERIRAKTANLSTSFQQKSISLTISVGLTAIQENENNIDSLINRADKALYQAKDSGRNRVIVM